MQAKASKLWSLKVNSKDKRKQEGMVKSICSKTRHGLLLVIIICNTSHAKRHYVYREIAGLR